MKISFPSKGITERTSRTGTGGRISAIIFGLIFGTVGLVMLVLAVRSSLRQLDTRHWIATPCEIVESSITRDDEQHRFDTVFTYNFNGNSYTGRSFTHEGGLREKHINDAQRLLSQYPQGTSTTCYVNPATPDEALIRRDLSVGGMIVPILLALPFVLSGYGVIFFVWRLSRPEPPTSDFSGGKPSRATMAVSIRFGTIFIVAGLGVTYLTFLGPFLRQRAARDWTPVEAVVEQSRVRSHSSDEDTTYYSVDITYRYHIDGRDYRGDRYNFDTGSSSDYEGKQRVVAAHPPGSTLFVYVNPADPFDSVIVRDMGATLYLGLLPLIFTVIGALALISGILRQRRRLAHPLAPSSAWTLCPAFRAGRPLWVLAFALFWNGAVSVFVVRCLREWQKGGRPIFLTLVLVPFVLIGAGCVVEFFIEMLRLFNPRIILIPPPSPLVPGAPTMIAYRIRGRIDRVTRLTISLVGSGVAKEDGDDAAASRELHRLVVYEQEQPMLMQEGLFRLTLPPALMGRGADPYNPITWHLEVKGEIPRGLDIVETYRLIS